MIFYFSGTGNTRWAAEKLAETTGERLLFIPEELKKGACEYTLQEGERLGFCFPVHGWQPPRIVRHFIRESKFNTQASTFVYTLVTCGDSIGRTMEMFNKELAAKGLLSSSVFSLIMPESYVCLPFMHVDTPEREHQKIAQASQDLQRYADMIRQKQRGETHTCRGLTPWIFSHMIGNYFNNCMISDRKFIVDADTCIHCGKCQKACPTGDVTLKNGLPSWSKDGSCTNCLACYHHCPQHAINYGKITRKRGQYYFGHEQEQCP